MDLLNDILKTQKLAREDKIKTFQTMFSEEPVAVKQANIKAQQVQELEDLKVKQEKELEALKDRHERSNEKLGLEKEKETENIAIQKQRDADRKANESFKPDTMKGYERVTDLYVQFRGDEKQSKKDFEQAKKIVSTYSKKHKLDIKDNPRNKVFGSPEEGSSAYKVSIFAKLTKDAKHDLRPLYTELSKLKTAEDHGIGMAKPLKESKVTCPECGGKGCDHCDDTGYHIKEGKLVTSAVDIIKLITKKVADRLEKEYSRNPEKGLGMINTIGSMVGHKVTDQKQQKGKLFLKFGEEVEEGYYSDKDKKQKATLKKHDKRMMKSAKDSIKKYEKGRKEEIDEDFMSFLAVALPAFMVVNAAAFIGLIAFEMAEIDIIGKAEKAIENIKSKFKRNKNYKPSKSELETLTKIGQEVKKKDPSAYKKAEAKAKSMKEETEIEEDRDYKKEYENYHSDPEQIKRRAKRNEARRSLKNSKKLTSDKDVHHKDNNPMNNDKSNLSIVTQNYNRKEPRMRDKLKEKGCLPNAKRK